MKSMFETEKQPLEQTRQHFYQSLLFPMLLIGALWLVHVMQWLGDWDPGNYGIMSRRIWGLRGIFTAPMVHGSWGHLLSNTFPLFVLTAMSAFFYRKVAGRAFWMIYILTGLCVWAFARPVSHIGASGVVYGLVAFIFWNGIFRRSMRSIILAGMVVLLYSGMFFGILPDQEGISWESHLMGSLVGIFASFWYKGELEDEESEREDPFAEERLQEKQYFLSRNAFDKTKAQRIAEAEEEARRRAENRDQGPPSWPFWSQNQTW